jgi:hypothetical protein
MNKTYFVQNKKLFCGNRTENCMAYDWLQDLSLAHVIKGEDFYLFFKYFIQHCFIRRPSNYTVSEDAGILLRIVATLGLVVRALTTRLYLIYT